MDLQHRLEIGVVEFVYKKRDGSYRSALGTRNLSMSFIDFYDVPMGIVTPPPHVLTYFDLDRMEWRCLRRNYLISYSNDIYIEI